MTACQKPTLTSLIPNHPMSSTGGPFSPSPLQPIFSSQPEPDTPFPWEEGGCGERSEETVDEKRSIVFDKQYRAKNVRVSPDRASASIRDQDFGGFVVCEQRMLRKQSGRWFEVRIEEVDASRWSDGLGIGFLGRHPSREDRCQADAVGNFEGLAVENFSDSWIVGYDGRVRLQGNWRYLRQQEMPAGPWQPSQLQPGDHLGLLVTPEGDLVLVVNAQVRVQIKGCGVPWKTDIFAVIDLDGSTKSVRLLDTNGLPGNQVITALSQLRAQEKSQESTS